MKESGIYKAAAKHYSAFGFDIEKLHVTKTSDRFIVISYNKTDHHYFFNVNLVEKISTEGNIAVDPSKRSEGIGRRLVECRESICKELGVTLVVINKPLAHSVSFWRHMGYRKLSLLRRIRFRRQLTSVGLNSRARFKEV